MQNLSELDIDAVLDRIYKNGNGKHEPELGDGLAASFTHQRGIALVGLPDCGHRALYNTLWGWEVLTNELSATETLNLGLFTLVNLPANPHTHSTDAFYPEDYQLIVYILSGLAGLRPEDFQWIARLRATGVPLLIVVNGAHTQPNGDALLMDISRKLAADVLPVNCASERDIHAEFLPAMIQRCPELGVSLAAEIISSRPHMARQYIREAISDIGKQAIGTLNSLDIDGLHTLQHDLVTRIAQTYGQQAANTTYITLLAVAMRQVERITQRVLDKDASWFVWVVSASLCTWLVGLIALYQYGGMTLPWVRKDT